MIYYRPIVQTDAFRPDSALPLAGGWCWFDRVEVLSRGVERALIHVQHLPVDVLARLSAPRDPVAGLALDHPRLMGILNVTPDSFSDGGRYATPLAATERGLGLLEAGADILDIGGESTRPGAAEVPAEAEVDRTTPVIAAIRAASPALLSIDTRKAVVARAALQAGASLVNDVAAFTHDPVMAGVVAAAGAPVCLMHAQGSPETMQADPRYHDVLLDVYDFLAGRVRAAEAEGIPRARILVDPGIGFGKTVAQNLALLRGISLFHGLGCGIVLGASRKRFIGVIGGNEQTDARMAGSVAVALAAVAQGVQICRVHDVAETRSALRLWQAVHHNDGEPI